MRALKRRVEALDRRLDPRPRADFLAYARAVVAYEGGDPTSETAVEMARWLEVGRWTTCGLG